jgi:hypothetical protein
MQPEKISNVGGKVKALSLHNICSSHNLTTHPFFSAAPKWKIEFHIAVHEKSTTNQQCSGCSAEPQIEAKIQLASL